jgi:cell shape-determining protein MreD
MLSWHAFKAEIVHSLGLTDDLMHVHLGMPIYVSASLLTCRSPRRWLWALLAVFGVEAANELVDVIESLVGLTSPNIMDGVLDVVHTLLWPSALTLVFYGRSRTGSHVG